MKGELGNGIVALEGMKGDLGFRVCMARVGIWGGRSCLLD